jgi:rhomboid protease GluP
MDDEMRGVDPAHGPDGRLRSPERPERNWEEIGPSAISPESRREPSPERIEAWSLVLDAQGIPHRRERSGWGGRLLVPADRREEALTALRLYEEENRDWPPTPPAAAGAAGIRGSLAALLLLAVFYHVTTLRLDAFGHHPIDWIALGSNDAAKVLSGQWWRLVTALTLHADVLHLLGNLLFGGILVVLLCGVFGHGLGWSLLLLSGILGNLASALAQGPSYDAVGASTALFGAIGVLAGRSALGGQRSVMRGWFLPLAAGAALLGMLGTGGERTDLGAHLFGFLSGLALGLLAGRRLAAHGRPGRNADALLTAAAALLPVLSWVLALSAPR